MKFEIKQFGADPYDIMCSEGPVHEIEWWEPATLKDLHDIHAEQLEMDGVLPNWARDEMLAEDWTPTPADFDEWLKQSMVSGYVRLAA